MKLLGKLAFGAAMIAGLATATASAPAEAGIYVHVGPGWHHPGWCR